MRQESNFPIKNQVLVCTHTRTDGRKSCGHEGQGDAIFKNLKNAAEQRGLHDQGQLRVSKSSCLGLCGKGPNVVVQPSGQWFSQVEEQDAEIILNQLELKKNQDRG